MEHDGILIFNLMQFNITHLPSRCVCVYVCVHKHVSECVCLCVLMSRTPFRAEWRISLHLFCMLSDWHLLYQSSLAPPFFQACFAFASSSFFSSSSPLLFLEQPGSLGSSVQLSAVVFGFCFSSSSPQQLLTHMFICFLQRCFFICSLYVLQLWGLQSCDLCHFKSIKIVPKE